MADIENIIANSKTIKQLTKDISTIAKNSGGSSTGGSAQGPGGFATGVNRVDQKIDDIKDAFANNATVKFFRNPAAVMAEGFKGIVKPFTDIPGKLSNSLKNLNPFGGQGGKNKEFKKLQKGIDKQTRLLETLVTQEKEGTKDEIKEGLAEGLGQTVIKDTLANIDSRVGKNLKAQVELQTRFALIGDSVKGFFVRNLKINERLADVSNFLTTGFLSFLGGSDKKTKAERDAEQRLLELDSQIEEYGKVANDDVVAQMRQQQDLWNATWTTDGQFRKPFQELTLAVSNQTNLLRTIAQDITGQLDLDIRKVKKEENSDQAEMEFRRDESLKQDTMLELLDAALNRNANKLGGDKKEDVKKGGIFGWIKENILGIGLGATAVGTTAAVGGIGGFFTGLTAIMTGVGAALPFYLKGAAALSVLALPIAAFGLAIPLLVKGLEGLTFEKLGLFAGLITTVGLIAAGLGLLIATGIGGLALAGGIVAIAALGLAIGGFGAGVALGEKGFNVLSNFFNSLSGIPNLGSQLLALGGLGGALVAIGGGGILSRFASGPLDNVSDFLDKIKGNTLSSAAVGLNSLAGGMAAVNAIEFDTDFTKSFKDVASYSFRRDLGKAADGFRLFIQKVGDQLDKLDVSKLETLIASADLNLQSVNAQGFTMESGQRALADNSNQAGGGLTQVDNSTRSGNTNITNISQVNPIVGDDTMQMVASSKGGKIHGR